MHCAINGETACVGRNGERSLLPGDLFIYLLTYVTQERMKSVGVVDGMAACFLHRMCKLSNETTVYEPRIIETLTLNCGIK